MLRPTILRNTHRRALTSRYLSTSAPRMQGLVNLFDAGDNPPLSVQKLTPQGFHLSDGLVVPGGLIFADGRAFMWDVDPPKATGGLDEVWGGWSPERFELFARVVPRPEILVFGTGERVFPAPKSIRDYVSSLGIQLDVMDTRNAASTYNLLFEEGRTVSAALCPLKPVNARDNSSR